MANIVYRERVSTLLRRYENYNMRHKIRQDLDRVSESILSKTHIVRQFQTEESSLCVNADSNIFWIQITVVSLILKRGDFFMSFQ